MSAATDGKAMRKGSWHAHQTRPLLGIYEYPLDAVEGQISPLQMKAECAAALRMCLNWSDVELSTMPSAEWVD